MQSVTEKDQRIKQLENENTKLLEKIKLLEHNVEALTQAVLHGAKKLFGRSSEKTPSELWQASFLDKEAVDNIPQNDTKVVNIKEHKRPIRKKGDREKLTAGIPKETVECVLNPDEAQCGICESELKVIGKKKVRSEMDLFLQGL